VLNSLLLKITAKAIDVKDIFEDFLHLLLPPVANLQAMVATVAEASTKMSFLSIPLTVVFIIMEHTFLRDTELETIINDFACEKTRRHETFRSLLFSKSTHSRSDRDQGHFNKFVTKYSSQSNAVAIIIYCADVKISWKVLVVIVRVSFLD